MKNFILITFLLVFSSNVGAQENDTLLRYDKESRKVYNGNFQMSMDNLFFIMRPYPETFKIIESARDCKFFANVCYVLGSIPIGYTIGYFLPSNEVKWRPLAAGLGLFAIAIPLHIRYFKQTQRAVDSYNSRNSRSFKSSSSMDMSLGITPLGIGIKIRL